MKLLIDVAGRTRLIRREGVSHVLRTLIAAGILTALLSPCALSQPTTPSPQVERLAPQELQLRQDWHLALAQVPLPKKGCFQASYPSKEWREVPCVKTPNHPMLPVPPRHGPRPLVVGNNNDVSAQAPTGLISTGIGSFQSVTGVTSESGPIGNTGPAINNAYTLQLNTNFFASSVCSASPNPACQGWQQFVFENDGSGNGVAYIQYWLIQYNATCPSGQSWIQIPLYGATYCYKNNSGGGVSVPNQPITNLGQLSLTGAVSSAGDSVSVFDGATAYAKNGDNAVNAAGGWNIAEFNVFGDGGNNLGGGQAGFNSGSSLVTKTRVIYGGRSAPNCVAAGFTAETNNLSFGSTAPTAAQPGPALAFSEDSAGGAPSNCAAATGIGDTHLKTFGGLFYDFQASGDFVLAQADPDFAVHTRQVSGAPQWPNAAVNSAVATRMGKDRVAVCLAPERLNVNGENIELGDTGPYSTPDGVDIWRRGNVYIITDASGNSVRAVVNPTWIDVTVGLGHWPANVTGLLANAGGNVNQIAARDGRVLVANQFSFDDFYGRFGESWRESTDDSLLSACGQRRESGKPGRPFYARDLERSVYDHAHGVCTTAGVKGETLLNACTLDVAVIGNDQASQVYVGMPEPVAVAIVPNPSGLFGSGYLKWLLLLLLLLIVLWIIRILLKRKNP